MIFGARLSLGSRVDIDKLEEGKGFKSAAWTYFSYHLGTGCAVYLLYS
jgi:hypothetical protein